MNTLSEQNESRCSETNTAADGDKRVNEFGDGCGHASTMCRPVLACVRKNFFTSPLCTTVCVCEKTLRLFEQTIHFELTAAPHLCPLCMSVYAHKLQTRADGEGCPRPRRIAEVSGCVGIVSSLGLSGASPLLLRLMLNLAMQ